MEEVVFNNSEGNIIYSYPFKSENHFDFQYRFYEEDNFYIIDIVKTYNDEQDDLNEESFFVKNLLKINKSDTKLDILISVLKKKYYDNEIFDEFLDTIIQNS